jgi:serine/threonine protein kinase
VVHRDVNPSNIGFRADGSAVLFDFNNAKLIKNYDATKEEVRMDKNEDSAASRASTHDTSRALTHYEQETIELYPLTHYIHPTHALYPPHERNPLHTTLRSSQLPREMTGDVGNLRYQSPEMTCHNPTGSATDVYSFAILAWEIASMQVPYGEVRGGKARKDASARLQLY